MLFSRLMMKNPTWGNDHLLLSVMLLLLLFLPESSSSKHTMQSQAPDPCWLLLVVIAVVMAELMPFLLPDRVFTSWKLLTIAAMLAKCYCSSCLSLLFFCSKCHIPHQLHLIWFKVSWTITSRISAVQSHLSSPFWKQSQQEFQLLNCIVIV